MGGYLHALLLQEGLAVGTPSGEETPGGPMNSVNQSFTLAHAPAFPGLVQVFYNGTLLLTPAHYTITGTTLLLGFAPNLGDNLICVYVY